MTKIYTYSIIFENGNWFQRWDKAKEVFTKKEIAVIVAMLEKERQRVLAILQPTVSTKG